MKPRGKSGPWCWKDLHRRLHHQKGTIFGLLPRISDRYSAADAGDLPIMSWTLFSKEPLGSAVKRAASSYAIRLARLFSVTFHFRSVPEGRVVFD